jgi:hypothetical protein
MLAWLAVGVAILQQGAGLYGSKGGWAEGIIDAEDWQLFSATADDVRFIRAPLGKTANPRLWLRVEFRDLKQLGVPGGTMSTTTLYEFDCAAGRTRALSSSLYPVRNIRGTPETRTMDTPQWTEVQPGTVGENTYRAACG